MAQQLEFPENVEAIIEFIKENKDYIIDIRGEGIFVDTEKCRISLPGTVTLSVIFRFLKLKEKK